MAEPPLSLTVPAELAGARLDRALAALVDGVSRAQARRLIDAGAVTVNGAVGKPSHPVASGDAIGVARLPEPTGGAPEPEAIPLDVLYEDDAVLVVNKPAGLVVHPAPGHARGTLVNALLHHTGGALGGGTRTRPGIVHRLDKDTSGVLVVAKTVRAHAALAEQFAAHTGERAYLALVWGAFAETRGTVDAPIGRSAGDRKRLTITGIGSRRAVTHFEVLATFVAASELRLRLETGRTHQVRLHCRYMDHPVIGDRTYGHRPPRRSVPWPDPLWQRLEALPGQLLHAATLGLRHPTTGELMRWHAPPPAHYAEFRAALAALPTP